MTQTSHHIDVGVSPYEQLVRSVVAPDTIKDVFDVTLVDQSNGYGGDGYSVGWGTKAECIEGLQQLIEQAQDALLRLEALSPCSHDWVADGDRDKPHNGGTSQNYRCTVCNSLVNVVVDKSTAQPWYVKRYYKSDDTTPADPAPASDAAGSRTVQP